MWVPIRVMQVLRIHCFRARAALVPTRKSAVDRVRKRNKSNRLQQVVRITFDLTPGKGDGQMQLDFVPQIRERVTLSQKHGIVAKFGSRIWS